MNTHRAENRTDVARFAEDMAKRDAEAAKRETGMLPSVAAMIGLGTAVLSFIP